MNYLGGPNTENTEFLKHCKWIHLVVTHPLCILSKYYSIRHTTLPTYLYRKIYKVSHLTKKVIRSSGKITFHTYVAIWMEFVAVWFRVQWAKNCAFIRYYIQIVTQVWYVIFPDVLITILIKWDKKEWLRPPQIALFYWFRATICDFVVGSFFSIVFSALFSILLILATYIVVYVGTYVKQCECKFTDRGLALIVFIGQTFKQRKIFVV